MNAYANPFTFAATARPITYKGMISTRDPITSPITMDALRAAVPSIFAEEAHESRSERYAYIPTVAILEGLVKEGFQVVRAQQSRTRDAGRREHTKHLIRMRHAGTTVRAVGDVFPEIHLINSHDGTSSYQISAAMFRLACLNGMVVSDQRIGTIRIGHSGDPRSKVIEGSYSILQDTVRALEAPKDWSQLQLTRDEAQVLAEGAHMLRFDGAEDGMAASAIKPELFLAPRRRGDVNRDLWTTFNVVQENAIRGGLSARTTDGAGRRRNVSTREVRGIDQDTALNKALWHLAERMAQLKAA